MFAMATVQGLRLIGPLSYVRVNVSRVPGLLTWKFTMTAVRGTSETVTSNRPPGLEPPQPKLEAAALATHATAESARRKRIIRSGRHEVMAGVRSLGRCVEGRDGATIHRIAARRGQSARLH